MSLTQGCVSSCAILGFTGPLSSGDENHRILLAASTHPSTFNSFIQKERDNTKAFLPFL